MVRYLGATLEADFALLIFLVIVLLAAVIIDMLTYKIPNLLTYPAIVLSVVFHTLHNGGSGFIFSTLGLMVGTGVFILPFLCGIMGAGDAKLMGTVGAVLGARGVLNAFLFTAVAGGVFSFLLLVIHYRGVSFLSRYAEMLKVSLLVKRLVLTPSAEAGHSPKMCYGVAIAAGSLYTLFWKLAYQSFPI